MPKGKKIIQKLNKIKEFIQKSSEKDLIEFLDKYVIETNEYSYDVEELIDMITNEFPLNKEIFDVLFLFLNTHIKQNNMV